MVVRHARDSYSTGQEPRGSLSGGREIYGNTPVVANLLDVFEVCCMGLIKMNWVFVELRTRGDFEIQVLDMERVPTRCFWGKVLKVTYRIVQFIL